MGAPESLLNLQPDAAALNAYIGLPYLANGRERAGLDCWGLVRLLYREQLNIALPSYADVDAHDADHVAEIMAREKEQWVEVDAPRFGDVVLLRINGRAAHVGLVSIPGRFIHCREGQDSVEESLESGKWRHRIVGYYRYSGAPIAVSAVPHPLRTQRIDCYLLPGQSLADLHASVVSTAQLGEAFPAEARIFVGGVEVAPELWKHCRPKPGTEITYRAVMRGSGVGRLLGAVAIAAVAWYAAPVLAGAGAWGSAGYAALGGATMGTAFAAAGINIVGGMLLNAIFPIRPPSQPSGQGPGRSMLMLQGGSNQLRPYGSIPLLLGRMRYSADLGAKTYYESTASDTYLRMLLVWGYGPMQITDLRIGDTPINDYEEVEYQTLDGIDDDEDDKARFDRLYGRDVEQLSPQIELEVGDAYVERTLTQEADEIGVTVLWPQGLRQMPLEGGKVGNIDPTTVKLSVQARQVGAATWNEVAEKIESEVIKLGTAYYNTDNDDVLEPVYRWTRISLNKYSQIVIREGAVTTDPDADPSGRLLSRLREESFGYETSFARLPAGGEEEERLWDICVYGNTVHSYVDRRGLGGGGVVTGCGLTLSGLKATIAAGSIARAQSETLIVKDETSDAFPRTVKFKVARGVYEVRIKRTDTNEKDFKYDSGNKGQRINTTVFQSVTSYLNTRPIRFKKPLAKTALRIRSSNQIQNTAPAVMATCTSICPDYDYLTDTWITRPTRNPASLARWVLQGPMNARPEPDSKLDFPWLKEFHNWCRTKKFTFDKLVTDATSLDSLLRDIMAAGRASPCWKDGKRSGIIDKPRTTVVQHFTPNNSWNFTGVRELPSLPHAFLVNFNNAEKGYQPDQMPVYADGYDKTNATRFEGIELPGQTVPSTIYSHARFHMGQVMLRPERYSLETDWENLVCTRGDLVRVTHDAPMWGIGSARIKDRLDARHILLDDALPMEAGVDYFIRIRTETGETFVRGVEPAAVDGRYDVFEMKADIDETLGKAGNLIQFGLLNEESVRLIVESIVPGPDYTARLTFSDYSPAIYDLDDEPIPAFNSHITELPNLAAVKLTQRPAVSSIRSGADEAVVSGSTMIFCIRAVLQQPASLPKSVGHVEAQISPALEERSWRLLPQAPLRGGVTFYDVVPGKSYYLRFRYVDSETGAVGPWSSEVLHTVVGLADLEPVSGLQLIVQNGVQKLIWVKPENGVLIPADYEIRVGPSAVAGTRIARTMLPELQLLGDGHYWVAARYLTRAGQYVVTGWQSLLVEGATLVQNVVATFDEAAQDWPGELSSTLRINGDGNLMLQGSGNIWDAPNIWELDNVFFYGGVAESGTYTLPEDEVVDVGRVADCGVRMSYDLDGRALYDNIWALPDIWATTDIFNTGANNLVSAQPQIAVAGDDGIFGDWQNLIPGVVTGRHFKFRLVIYSHDYAVTAVVSALTVEIDVPDRLEHHQVATSSSSTVDVAYDVEFNGGPGDSLIPLVQGTIVNAQAGDDLVITNQTATGCTVEVRNGGVRVVRTVNIQAQGF